MSTTVDERVVSLQFDNKQFESGVKESMSTLDKLKEKLSLKGASKAAESEFDSYKSGFISLKDSINKMWSTWEYEIGGKMKNMVKMFTIDPIKTGLSEYETQLNSVQTILANTESKGSTLKDVNAALDELNAYADKTIYNFTEMTRNIGTFTAAGVDLDKSVSAIKGIANLAAVSGSTSQQASTAMYQLSQALASGTVKLMDWNSVVNAGMGGQVFQDALKETARAHGVAIDEIIKNNGSFRESLQEGWLTSEILTQTLSVFTGDLSEAQLKSMGYTDKQIKKFMELGKTANEAATKVKTFSQLLDTLKEAAQSGWAQTWELIFGDFEEAKEFWTKVSDEIGGIIGDSAEKRNKLIAGALNSGWSNFLSEGSVNETGFLNYIKGAAVEGGVEMDKLIEQYGSLDKAIDASIKDGTITHDMLAKALNNLSAETGTLSEEQLKNLGITKEQAEEFAAFNEKIQNGDASIEDFYKKMQRLSGRELLFNIEYDENGLIKYNERTGALVNIYGALKKVMDTVAAAWREVFPEATSEGLYQLLDKFREFTSHLIMTDETADKVKRTLSGLFSVLSLIWSVVKLVFSVIVAVLKQLKPLLGLILRLTSALGSFVNGLRETVKSTGSFEKFSTTVIGFINEMADKFKEFAESLKQKIQVSGLTGFMAFLKGLWTVVKTIFNGIITIVKAIGKAISDTFNGSGVGGVMDLLNAGLLTGLIVGVKKIFDNVKNLTDAFDDILGSVADTLKAFTAAIKAKALESIATSILMLAAAILVIALIDQDKLEKSLAALAMLFAGLMGAMSVGAGAKKSAITAVQMIGLAASMLVLASVLKKISTITDEKMLSSVLVMTACMVALTGTLAALSKIKSRTKMATEGSKQLFKISLSLIPTVFVLQQLAKVYWKDLLVSFGVMAGALAAFTGVLYVLSTIKSKTKMAQEGAKKILVLSLSLIPLAIAFRLLSKMSWEEIGKTAAILAAGLTVMTVAMVALQKMDKATSKLKDNKANNLKIVIGKCVQLTLIAGALLMLAGALLIISFISWEGLAKGLVGVGATLAILLSVFKIIAKTESTDAVVPLITLMGMASMMISLATSLAILGQMEWDTIAKGLTAMAGVMVILCTALKTLSKVSSVSKKASLSVMGKDGVFSKKGGIFAMFSGKASMSEHSNILSVAAALVVFAASIKILASSLVILGQLKWSSILKGLTAIVGVVTILALASKFITISSKNLLALSGAIALMGFSCLAAGLGITLMAKSLEAFASALGNAIVALCQVIMQSSHIIAQTIVKLIVDVLKGLSQVIDTIVETLLTIILNVISSLSTQIPSIASAFMDLLIGVIDEVINYLPQIEELLVKLIGGIFDLIGNLVGKVDTDGLVKAAAAIGIMAAMTTTLASISIKMLPKALAGALGMIALVTLIGVALGLLNKIPGLSDLIGNGGELTYAIGYVLGSFVGGLMAGMAGLKFGSSGLDAAIETIKKICAPEVIMCLAMVAGLTAIIGMIGKMETNFLEAFAGTAMVLGGIALVVTAFSAIGAIKGSLDFFKRGVEILKVVCSPEVIVSLGLISVLTAVLGLLGKVTSSVGSMAKTIACLAMVSAVVMAITAMFGGFASIPGAKEVFTKGAELMELIGSPKMLLTLGGFTLLMGVLGLVGPVVGPALIGVAGLIAVVTALGAYFAALGWLAKEFPNITPLIEGGGDLLQSIGEAIGKFFGGILGGILEAGIVSTLPSIATSLSDFMTNLQPFIDGCKNINADVLAGVGILAASLLALTATSVITGLTTFLTGGLNFVLLKKNFEQLAEAMVKFNDIVTTGNVNADTVKKGAEAAAELAKACGKIPGIGGLKQFCEGTIDIAGFGRQLKDLGTGVVDFHNAISTGNLDLEIIKTGCKGVAELTKVAEDIPSASVFESIPGLSDIETFARGIKALGKGVVDFQTSIAGGEQPVNLATIQLGGDAIVALAQAVENIPNTSVWEKVGNWFKGSSKEDDFANNLGKLGKGVKSFADSISGVSPEEVAAGGYAAAALAEAVNQIPEEGGIWNMDMPTLQSKFEGLANAVKSYVSNMEQVSDSAIAAAGMKLSRLNDALTAFSTAGIDSIINSFNNSRTNVAASIISVLDACIVQVGEYNSRLKDAGAKLGEQLEKGLTSKKSTINKAFSDVLNSASNAVEDAKCYDKFKDVGSDLVDGFVSGIDENTFKAKAAAKAMAEAAYEAAKEVLKINSPSKVFEGLGSGCGEGMVGGLNSFMGNVYDASYDMGDTAIGAISNSIAKVAQTIENGIDDQITIRPVLDLSEVSNGINTMNGMLDTNPSIGVMAKVDSISSSMNKNQNGSNSDVVTAIDSLKDTMLANTGTTNYTINGITYDDGSEIQNAIETIVRAIIKERRS